MGWLSAIFGRRRRAQRRQVEGAIRAVLDAEGPDVAWRQTAAALRSDPEAGGLLHLAAHVLRVGGEPQTAELFDRAADAPHDPQRLFELGSELLSEEQPELAAVLLERALRFVPFDAVVRSELALAHARAGRPDKVLATLALHPCLADDPGALFEFGWASMLTGDLDAATGALRELHGAVELRRKLASALERAREFPPADARGFYFVEHGAVLLDDGGPIAGRYAEVALEGPRLARVLAEAAWVARAVGVQAVHVLDEAHRPLAEHLASAIGASLRAVPERGRVGPGLLPLWRGATLEGLDRDAYDRPGTYTLALAIDHRRSLVHAPELVGVFAREATFGDLEGLPPARAERAPGFVPPRRELLFDRGVRLRAAYLPDAPIPL